MGRPGCLRPRRGQAHRRQQGEVGIYRQIPQGCDGRAREDSAIIFWRGEGDPGDVGVVSAFDIFVGAGAVDEYFRFGLVSAELETISDARGGIIIYPAGDAGGIAHSTLT